MNYQFMSYCTEYSSKGTDNRRMTREVCFAAVFHGWGRKPANPQVNYYQIKIHKGEALVKDKLDNNCLVDINTVRKHMDIMRNFVKFNYKVMDKKGYFLVHLHLNAPNIYHRLVLTWLRYLYEFPYNFIVADMVKIRKLNTKMNSLSSMNMFNLIGETLNVGGAGGHSIISFCWPYKFVTTAQLKETLKDINQLCYLFPRLEDKHREELEKAPEPRRAYESDFWQSEDAFKERVALYEKNYKTLRKLSHGK